jgi:hypothetical protein
MQVFVLIFQTAGWLQMFVAGAFHWFQLLHHARAQANAKQFDGGREFHFWRCFTRQAYPPHELSR